MCWIFCSKCIELKCRYSGLWWCDSQKMMLVIQQLTQDIECFLVINNIVLCVWFLTKRTLGPINHGVLGRGLLRLVINIRSPACDFSLTFWEHCCLPNTITPEQKGRHFADDTFKCIFLAENCCISIQISPKFIQGSMEGKSALVQAMAWCRSDDKPLAEPMMIQFSDAYIH